MNQLEGKVALITGGGTGIGAAIAKRFVTEGAKVCITGRRKEVLSTMAKSFPAGTITTISGDVVNSEDIERMVKATLEFGGRLDILVNNAAVNFVAAITDLDPSVWRQIVEVNLTAPFLLMRASIPHMIKGGGGSIINIASLGAVRCMRGMPAYAASKGGLVMLTQQAALEYGPHKIRCNAVCPGMVRTPMVDEPMAHFAQLQGSNVESMFANVTKDVPLHRAAHPSEIAGICSYLASDDSSFMTGSCILIDGGAAVMDIAGPAIPKIALGKE